MNTFWAAVAALVPSIGVGVIFYFVMRFIVRADRNERAELAKLDEAEKADSRDIPRTGTSQDEG